MVAHKEENRLQQGPQKKARSVDVQHIMWHTNAALLPGIVVLGYFYGVGYLWNLSIAIATGVCVEILVLRMRSRNWKAPSADGSVVLTGALIALAAPPMLPPLVLMFAVACAVALAKHAFGGIGRNLFNPAMVGYALALISFPAAFALWSVPTDGVTAATALDALKTLNGFTMSELQLSEKGVAAYGFGRYGGYAAEQAGVAFAAGGVYICWRKFAAWRVVAGFLFLLLLCAAFGYDNGSSTTGGSPAQHLLSGGTLLAAFFVLTDPVTHPSRRLAQWAFGALAGVLTYCIRVYGAYPDGIAFAVLIANAASPLLNQWAANVELRKNSARSANQ